MGQYTLPSDGTASEMFTDTRSGGGGGPCVHCSCGIDHYSIQSARDFDELDSIPEASETVVHHDDGDDCVSYYTMGNRTFVYACEGCSKTARRYEDFIWENRNHIRQYLKVRIDQELAWAQQEDLLNKLNNIG